MISGSGKSKIPGHLSWILGANHLIAQASVQGEMWINAALNDVILCKTSECFDHTIARANGPFANPQNP